MRPLPAEWHSQSCVLIAWPSPDSDFSSNLTEVENCYRLITMAISSRQKLLIACQNQHQQHHVQKYLNHLPDARSIDYTILPFDDIWVRDTAPLSRLSNQGVQLINFSFNGWGEKYPHQADTEFSQNLYQRCLSRIKPLAISRMQTLEMVLEGGSIDSDGAGTVLTTRNCLLNPNRNPKLNQQQIESLLLAKLGIKRIHWLSNGSIEGDDTDAHIDTLARFCSTNTIAYSSCDDVDDSHYNHLKQMEKELQRITSEAYRKAQEIKGKADAQATVIYAEAYNKDPEFYSFIKTLDTYKNSLAKNSTLVINTDNNYFKYLKNMEEK